MVNRKDDQSVTPGKKELARLMESMKTSGDQLKSYRGHVKLACTQLAGKWYGKNGQHVPVNFIELLDGVFMRHLITSTPRAMIRARRRELAPKAAKLRIAVDSRAERIYLRDNLQMCAKDALYGAGLLWQDTEPAIVNIAGERRRHYSYYASRFSIDDFRVDPDARTIKEAEFIAHRVRVDWQQFKRSKLYRNFPSVQPDGGEGPWDDQEDRIEDISKSEGSERGYRDSISLWNIWLPRKAALITVPVNHETVVVRSEKWTGPSCGPFKMLGYGSVPDQLMPLAPMAALMDLHGIGNSLFSKITLDCKDAKTIYGVALGSEADANRIIRAAHGTAVPMADPSSVKEFRYGGAEPQTIAMFLSVKELFSWFAGNLDMMGGLGAQSPTATQDQMLMSSASKRVAAMQQAMREFTADVLRDMAWYEWNDQLLYATGSRDVPGLGQRTVVVTARDFEDAGDFFDYEFDVEADSMLRKTPAERAQIALQFATQILIPLAPVLSQQGIGVDFNALLRLFATNQGVPELLDILTTEINPQPEESGAGGGSERPRQSPVTERRYVRTNRAGTTPTSGAAAAVAALAGQGGANNNRGVA